MQPNSTQNSISTPHSLPPLNAKEPGLEFYTCTVETTLWDADLAAWPFKLAGKLNWLVTCHNRTQQERDQLGISTHVHTTAFFYMPQAWHSTHTHCTTCRLQLNTQILALGMDTNCKWTAAEAKKQSFEGGVWVWAHLLPCFHEDPSEWFPQP
jgi:hypothetical protein